MESNDGQISLQGTSGTPVELLGFKTEAGAPGVHASLHLLWWPMKRKMERCSLHSPANLKFMTERCSGLFRGHFFKAETVQNQGEFLSVTYSNTVNMRSNLRS